MPECWVLAGPIEPTGQRGHQVECVRSTCDYVKSTPEGVFAKVGRPALNRGLSAGPPDSKHINKPQGVLKNDS
jgi:hypothetical protein